MFPIPDACTLVRRSRCGYCLEPCNSEPADEALDRQRASIGAVGEIIARMPATTRDVIDEF